MEKLEQLNLELELLRKNRDYAEEEFDKKLKDIQIAKKKIRDSLPELFGVVIKTNTKASKKLIAGEIYSLDYDEEMEPVFHTYQRNYSESDTEHSHCPYCCKMKICTWEELSQEQGRNVIYAAYR